MCGKQRQKTFIIGSNDKAKIEYGYVYSPLRQPTCRRQTDRQTNYVQKLQKRKQEEKNS